MVFDIPADVTELPTGRAGDRGRRRRARAQRLRREGVGGAAPPPGDPHRYVFAVHALDVETLGLDSDTMPAVVGFNITAHTLARASIVVEYGS